MTSLRLVGTFALLIFSTVAAHAEGPGSGTMTIFGISERTVPSSDGQYCYGKVTAKWDLDSLFGEPLVRGSWKWESGRCGEAHYSTVAWLRIQGDIPEPTKKGYGRRSLTAYVKLSPLVPGANEGFGFNVAGSPPWDELLCSPEGYRGWPSQLTELSSKKRPGSCLTAQEAKRLWAYGKVTAFGLGHNKD